MKSYNIKTMHEWPLPARLFILALIFFIVFFIAYKWDITSLKENLGALKLQETDLKLQFELVAKKKANLQADIAQYPVLKKASDAWKKQFILQENLPELLNEILKMGSSNQLYFTILDPGEAVKADFYFKIPIKVTVVGDYHQLANFISQMANMDWIVEIGNFLISDENRNDLLGARLAEMANAQNLLTAEMNLTVYYLPKEEASHVE